jgi:hypothetical protein
MSEHPTKKELRLAIEALIALVDDEFPARPLKELAYIFGGTSLTGAHYDAIEKVDKSFFCWPEAPISDGNHPSQPA